MSFYVFYFRKLSTQNHSSQPPNDKREYELLRIDIRKMLDVLSHGHIDNVRDVQVEQMLIDCIRFGFVEELRLAISLLKSTVE